MDAPFVKSSHGAALPAHNSRYMFDMRVVVYSEEIRVSLSITLKVTGPPS